MKFSPIKKNLKEYKNTFYYGSSEEYVIQSGFCKSCKMPHGQQKIFINDNDEDNLYVLCPKNNEKIYLIYE